MMGIEVVRCTPKCRECLGELVYDLDEADDILVPFKCTDCGKVDCFIPTKFLPVNIMKEESRGRRS